MTEAIPPELTGAWRLVDLEERDSDDGPWGHPLGEDVRGVLFCDAAGVLSAHIHAPSAPEPRYRNVAYFGFFTVRGVERGDDTVRGELLYELDAGTTIEIL